MTSIYFCKEVFLLLILFVVFAVFLIGFALANRFYVPPAFAIAPIENQHRPAQPDLARIRVVTWNIGYAGMGRDSDFVFDLGQQKRPLEKSFVDVNLQAIQKRLQTLDADLYMLQEAALPSWLTYQRDIVAGVVSALPQYAWTFGADASPRLMPPPFNIKVGNMILSRFALASAERRGLPLEPTFELGLFRKGYRLHIVRSKGPIPWVFINIHLSTFDTEQDDVRRQQVIALLEFATDEYAKGNYVVIGGDWNLDLTGVEFPHQTDARYLFWIRSFPADLVPKHWKWAVDPSVPTVRTAHQPYVRGDNCVLTIDGFLVSPNVNIVEAKGIDLGFAHTDHHPVRGVFEANVKGAPL